MNKMNFLALFWQWWYLVYLGVMVIILEVLGSFPIVKQLMKKFKALIPVVLSLAMCWIPYWMAYKVAYISPIIAHVGVAIGLGLCAGLLHDIKVIDLFYRYGGQAIKEWIKSKFDFFKK